VPAALTWRVTKASPPRQERPVVGDHELTVLGVPRPVLRVIDVERQMRQVDVVHARSLASRGAD
jgi:hypothetical protein